MGGEARGATPLQLAQVDETVAAAAGVAIRTVTAEELSTAAIWGIFYILLLLLLLLTRERVPKKLQTGSLRRHSSARGFAFP